MANPAPHTASLFLVYIKSTTGVLRRQAATIQIAFRGSRLFPSRLCHLHHLTSWVTISMVTGSSHRRKRAWRVPCGSFCRPVLGVAHWTSAHNSYVGHNSVTWPVPNIKVKWKTEPMCALEGLCRTAGQALPHLVTEALPARSCAHACLMG